MGKKRHTSFFSRICREIRTKFHKKFAEKIGNSFFIREKMLTIFGWNFEIEERCKGVHCVDSARAFSVSLHVPFLNLLFELDSYSNEYLFAKIGVDTAENEALEVWEKIQFIFHLPP